MIRAEELAERARPCSVCAPRVEPALSELVADAEALAKALEREKRAADVESEHLTLQLHTANARAEALAEALERERRAGDEIAREVTRLSTDAEALAEALEEAVGWMEGVKPKPAPPFLAHCRALVARYRGEK